MATDLFGFGAGSLASQQRVLQAQKEFLNQNPPRRRGETFVDALGQRAQQKRTQRKEENTARVINEEREALMSEPGEGPVDIAMADANALIRAAARFQANGNHAQARELFEAGKQQIAAIQQQRLEQNVLRSQIQENIAQAGQAGRANQPNTQVIQSQRERANLLDISQSLDPDSPAFATIMGRVDELNASIEKENAIVGRTEFDVTKGELTTTTINDLQTFLGESQDQLDALNQTMEVFDPQMFTLGGRLEGLFLSLRDIAGMELSAEDKRTLVDRTMAVQGLRTQLNEYIRATTGAQVGQGDETTRLKGAVPNEGDGPTVLQTKIDIMQEIIPAQQARASAALAADDVSILQQPLENFKTEPEIDPIVQALLDRLPQ
jgi:hypothetical protein